MELEEKRRFIDLLAEMIRVCSSTWNSSSSTMGLIDPLIIAYAKRKGLVCRNSISTGDKERFEGAFVNDPVMGIHSWVVDLDYTSLYPSIISSFNIDVTTYIAKISPEIAEKYIYYKDDMPNKFGMTLDPWRKSSSTRDITLKEFDKFIENNDAIVAINGTIFMGHSKKTSFIGEICSYVLNSRKEYKEKRDSSELKSIEYLVSDNRQEVYKVLANALYGVFGNKHFRMFNLDVAETITLSGQEINQFAQYHAGWYLKEGREEIDVDFRESVKKENPPYIIAGDTDSLFLAIGEYLKDKRLL